MDGDNRSTLGERLVSRILTRSRRRPRMGLSPDFYARFGVEDPWGAPELPGAAPDVNEGFVYLSVAPYYAMMRRLAAARKRRERRLAAFAERRAGSHLRAATRTWPGESVASLVSSRIARVALDSMTLPPQVQAQTQATVVEQDAESGSSPTTARGGRTRTNRGANAWWSTPFIPARVFRGSDVDPRSGPSGGPMARVSAALSTERSRVSAAGHAGARLALAATRSGTATKAIEAALPAALVGTRRAAVARIAEVIEALPADRQATEIRRVIRRMGGSAPAVRTVYEDAAPATRPSHVAARRADLVPTAGLRPVLSRSPAMALAAAPELDRAASGTLATAERVEDARGLSRSPRRLASSQRAMARAGAAAPGGTSVPSPLGYARAVSTRLISASPVSALATRGVSNARGAATAASPAASRSASRAAVTLAAAALGRSTQDGPARGGAARSDTSDGVSDLGFGSAAPGTSRPTLRASARAVARTSATPVDRFAGPVAAVAGPVRTAEGRWVPARAATAPERAALAPRRLRRAETAHAARRVDAGLIEGRSVLPRAIPGAATRVYAEPAGAIPVDVSQPSPLAASPVSRSSRAVGAWGVSASPAAAAGAVYVPARSLRSSKAVASAGGFRSPAERAGARSFDATPDVPARSEHSRGADASASRSIRDRATTPSSRTLPSADLRPVTSVEAPPGASEAASARGARAVSNAAGTFSSRAAAEARGGAGVVRAAHRGEPAASGRSVVGESIRSGVAFRATIMRSPSLSHASARVDIPSEESTTLQPRVTQQSRRAAARRAPGQLSLSAPPSPARRSPTRAQQPRVVGTVAAAERFHASKPRSTAAARAFDALPSAPAPMPRFARSGPLAWTLAAPQHSPAADVSTAEGTVAPRARVAGRRPARAERPVRAWSAEGVAPLSAVSNAAGVYMSASAAARVPGARLLRTEAGRLVAVVGAPAERAGAGVRPAARAPTNVRSAATVGAAYAQPYATNDDASEEALVAPASPARRRASQWAAARTGVENATAYRGAFRTPESRAGGAFRASEAERADGPAPRTPTRRERPRRIAASAGEMSLPAQAEAASAAGTPGVGAARRTGLEERLQDVAMGSPGASAPVWASRSDGAPRVRSSGGIFEDLARASTAEEIIRVIYARADGVRETPLAREAPVVQVIEQIRQEVRREQNVQENATRASRLDAPSATVIRGEYVRPVPSTTRVRRGSVRGVASTAQGSAAGGGDERIMKLVKKLQGLIHLAEAEGRLAQARSQVRLAEDTPGARAEGQGPVGAAGENGEKREKQDIEALGREVLEVVTRELEHRRSRRVEDHDESVWW